MIQLKDITVDFSNKEKKVRAVDHVSLNVNRGDIFGIVGYSGAGKSTLVRVINLLQRPSAGEVLVNGQDLLSLKEQELRASRKKIGMIFQHFNLMNARTIFNNVAFALKGSDLTKQQKSERVKELLELVGLSDKANNYPSQLSGGQKQRVGIARALANHPDILISDEATSALDPKTTQSILELLNRLNKQLGLTIVLITHQMEAVKQISHQVAVMDQGRIIEEGSVYQIFSEPKTALTKSFINTTTRLDETLAAFDVRNLKAGEKMLQLSYLGESADEPLISSLYQKFQVSANILYGNIEMLQGQPLGNLVVILSGQSEQITQAIDYLKQSKVHVREIEGIDEK
ncbi:methionine ABC transporter ATP-binding protein [Xylocopilactobacillus apicola]|uniref:methionine ABC transporter ATP-binding protein n=1 Tax=Xylocopilactobacillus apicola TaxID=2932184 RepID=UPI002954ADF4|nr:ATP-binding cassette domain-containing protein [Xylocopilactobacillus apicola]